MAVIGQNMMGRGSTEQSIIHHLTIKAFLVIIKNTIKYIYVYLGTYLTLHASVALLYVNWLWTSVTALLSKTKIYRS